MDILKVTELLTEANKAELFSRVKNRIYECGVQSELYQD